MFKILCFIFIDLDLIILVINLSVLYEYSEKIINQKSTHKIKLFKNYIYSILLYIIIKKQVKKTCYNYNNIS